MWKYIKSFLAFLFTVAWLFLSLELITRVGYYIRTNDVYYLSYGNVAMRCFLNPIVDKITGAGMYTRNAKLDFTMAVFGGSTTNQGEANSQFEYSKFLQNRLNKEYPGSNSRVLNFGCGGLESGGELERMKAYLTSVKTSPDVIFVYTGLNDANNVRHVKKISAGRTTIYEFEIMRTQQDRLKSADKTLESCSLFYSVMKEKIARDILRNADFFNRLQPSSESKGAGETVSRKKNLTEEAFLISRVETFSRNVRDMIKLCKRFNVRLYFGVNPVSDSYKKEKPELVSLLNKIYASLREEAREYNIPVIDIAAVVDALPKADRSKIFAGDGMHMYKEGNEIVAGVIYKKMEKDIAPLMSRR